jgi:hypothetical protein
MVDVRSVRGSDCNADYYLVVTTIGQRLSVSKRAAQKFHDERFDLKKLNDVDVKEQYQVKISNRFTSLETLDDNMNISEAWKGITNDTKT